MATTSILLQTWKPNKKGFPVKIRVIHKRQSYYIKSGYSLTEADFSKVISLRNVPQRLNETVNNIHSFHSKVKSIVERLQPFSWPEFKKALSTVSTKETLETAFKSKIKASQSENTKGILNSCLKS